MTKHGPPRSSTHITVRENGVDQIVALPLLLQRFGASVGIRLQEEDFAQLRSMGPLLTHFNLGSSIVPAGTNCVLLPIIRAGSRDLQAVETLPVIDPARARRATCVSTVSELTVDTVTAEQFATSLPSIRTASALREALLRRYRPQWPGRSNKEILSQGCTATLLRLDKCTNMSGGG